MFLFASAVADQFLTRIIVQGRYSNCGIDYGSENNEREPNNRAGLLLGLSETLSS
jgi:hypothetical protein